MRPIRVAFVVQGEGRGHMTQALALAGFLTDAGHEIVTVLVGTSPHRTVPRYFVDGMRAPVITFDAPTQVPGRDQRGVSVLATTRDAALRMPRFFRSGLEIHRRTADADVVVNLLDLVGGASRLLFRSHVPAVAIAHNHLFAHPGIGNLPGRPHARRLVRLYTEATALRSVTRVALSFVPMAAPDGIALEVAPPLLRPGLDALEPHDGGYLLVYALNAGYGDLVARWQAGREDVVVHCYVDGGPAALRDAGGPGFHAHPLDQEAFLKHLAGCRGFVGSAGFESLCEAFYLGKPVLAVPTDGQLEQTWNAWDAERRGVARWGTWRDLASFHHSPGLPDPRPVGDFRAWVRSAPERHVAIVERAASGRDSIQHGEHRG
jgi:uncharacterized protein (TIGR00661 family)